jgi:hypothetical protein
MRFTPLRSFAVVLLLPLAACVSAPPPPQPQPVTKTTTSVVKKSRGSGIGTVAAGAGVYRIRAGMDEVERVRIVPKEDDEAAGRLVEAGRWHFDRSANLVRIDDPVDAAGEKVMVEGTRSRPPQFLLPEGTQSVRVVVGDRLGVEGADYTIDRSTGMMKMLGPDTPENPLRYYVETTLARDPAQSNWVTGVSFGNLRDQETIHRVLGTGKP